MYKDKYGRTLVVNIQDGDEYVPRKSSQFGKLQHMSGIPIMRADGDIKGTTQIYIGNDAYEANTYADGTLLYSTSADVIQAAEDAVKSATTARARLQARVNRDRALASTAPAGRVSNLCYFHAGKIYALATRAEMVSVPAPAGMRDAVLKHTQTETQSGKDITANVVDAMLSRVVCLSDLAEGNFGIAINANVSASTEHVSAIALLFNFIRDASRDDVTAIEYADAYARDAFVLAEAVRARGTDHKVNAFGMPFELPEVVEKLSGLGLTTTQKDAMKTMLSDVTTGILTAERDLLIFGESLMNPYDAAVTAVGDKLQYSTGAAAVSVDASRVGSVADVNEARRVFRTAVASAYSFLYGGSPDLFTRWAGYPNLMRKPAV